MALIDELYTEKEAEFIKSIYHGDEDSHPVLMKSIGSKIIGSDKILVSSAIDIIMMVCMNASFAHTPTECNQVAMIVHKTINSNFSLPYFLDDQGMVFAEKSLIALTFFGAAMERRHTHQGAPPTGFYRDMSKAIMNKYEHEDVADNHHRWEAFLSEMFFV